MSLIQKNSPDTNTDWLTPPEIIAALGSFDLDPCCPPVMPWWTARSMYTQSAVSCKCIGAGLLTGNVNGLTADWRGRVWLNPPFRGAEPWMSKLAKHGDGIALVPVATGTQWFQKWVFEKASGILFFPHRLRFCTPSGEEASGSINRDCCLVAYDRKNLAALLASDIGPVMVKTR